jgi:hypothetical protein
MTSLFLPRGIRNNNPGNIRLSQTRWQGQKPVQVDNAFIEFETPVAGLRALMRLLLTYHHKFALNTVESIITRYAPPHENATDAYIHHVARRLGVKRREVINPACHKTLVTLARAITAHENGPAPAPYPQDWFDDATYQAALHLLISPQTA